MNIKNKKIFSEKGTSLIELAFVLPLMFAFLFVGIEYTRSLRVKILTQNFTREVANTLNRNCLGLDTDADIQTCINNNRDVLASTAQNLVPGTRIYAGLYYNNGPKLICNNTGDIPNSTYPSRIKGAGLNCGVLDTVAANVLDVSAIMTAARKVVVVEMVSPYQQVLGFVPGLFSYNPQFFYAVTTI